MKAIKYRVIKILLTVRKRLSLCVAAAGLLLSASPQAHQGIPNVGASEACTGQLLGDACEWSDAHDALYVGTCRKVTSSLQCVRNKPIIYPKDHSAESHDKEH